MNRLITMAGPALSVPISDMSNYEAGLAMLGVINQVYPGIKFGQLYQLAYGNRPETMGRKWWERAGSALNPVNAFNSAAGVVGDVKDGIGDVLKDSFDATAGAGGDLIRLFTDEKVIAGANSSYESFTGSGGVGGAVFGTGIFGGGGGTDGGGGEKGLFEWIVNLGSAVKGKAGQVQAASAGGEIPGGILPWAVGGVTILWLLTRRR